MPNSLKQEFWMALIGKYFPKQAAPNQGSAPPSAARGANPMTESGGVPVVREATALPPRPPISSAPIEASRSVPAYTLPGASGARPAAPPSPLAVAADAAPAPVVRSDRVMPHIPVASNTTDLPAYLDVLTAIGSVFEMPNTAAQHCAALLVDQNTVVIVWTNMPTPEARSARQHLWDRLAAKGYTVREQWEAPETVVRGLNLSGAKSRRSNVQGVEVDKDHIDKSLDYIVGHAVGMKASDIHIEVSNTGALVRFRMFGELYLFRTMTFTEAEDFSRGLYFRSESGTKGPQFDKNDCQDSSIRWNAMVPGTNQAVPVKLRFSSRPAYPEGWDITLRVLNTKSDAGDVETFEQLGYDEKQIEAFEYAYGQAHGVMLMAGETGSGKSTTLRTTSYALHERSGGRRKQISVEDPPEYILPGRQTPVHRTTEEVEKGVDSYARYLKAAMRGDPDILLVGEARDPETARAIVTATLSGHKVLATLHAASPFAAFQRLEQLGIQRSVLTAPKFISAIVHQKLVAVLCPHCSVQMAEMGDSISAKLRRRLMQVASRDGGRWDSIRFRGPGCAHCLPDQGVSPLGANGPRGVVGRTVVAEMLVPDATILGLIGSGDLLGAERYWRAAAHDGANIDTRGVAMGRTAMDQAVQKMLVGMLDPRDVERAVGFLDDQETAKEAYDWWKLHRTREHTLRRGTAE